MQQACQALFLVHVISNTSEKSDYVKFLWRVASLPCHCEEPLYIVIAEHKVPKQYAEMP